MNKVTSLLTLLLLCTAFPADAMTRREAIQQGEEQQKSGAQTQRKKSNAALTLTYKTKIIPLLGFSFRYPEQWNVGFNKDTDSKFGQYYMADGDYVYVTDEQYDETYSFFIVSKKFSVPATMEMLREEMVKEQRQPDHNNVYEYSHLSYARELDVIKETETTFLGKPALELEYTFNNWSKFWKEYAIKFPWGKRIYTMKYRAELGHEDKFYEAYQELLRSFTFLGAEPNFEPLRTAGFNDVATSHRNHKAIARLRDLHIIGGYSDGSFKPDNTINRAEFMKIMTSEPLVPLDELARCNTSSFPDVPPDAWFTQHICVGKARGMIGGYPDGTFRPEKTISFVEAAKIISTFFDAVQVEDVSLGEGWYLPFVRGLERKRAIPTTIRTLSSSVRRGEMSEIIYRLHDNIEGESKNLKDLE